MTARADPGDNDFVQVDVSDDITTAVALEAQIRSQGIQAIRMDHGFEGPPGDDASSGSSSAAATSLSSSKCLKSYRVDINLERL